jgi:hypothetical protein
VTVNWDSYRTDGDAVRAELQLDGHSIEGLTGTIIETVGVEPAHMDVNDLLADTGLSEDRLRLIERYIAGHELLSSGIDELRQVDSETLSDGSSATYVAPTQREGGYDETSLGRKAIRKDTSNTLDNVDTRTASIGVPKTRE